jgi:hypothetical protein
MRGRATVRDLSVFAGWFGLPKILFESVQVNGGWVGR